MPIITVHDDRDSLPSNIRVSCFPFSHLSQTWHSYSLSPTLSAPILLRRTTIILILAIRTLLSILALILHRYNPLSFVLALLVAVIGFFFIAACLALIGDMYGTRVVCGMVWSRAHFDMFLALVVLVHCGMLAGGLWTWGIWGAGVGVGGSLWVLMWLAIWGVAWVASWEGESVRLV
jgi:hypothetical protein